MDGEIRPPAVRHAPVVTVGRPRLWMLLASALVVVAVTVDLLSRGRLEWMDLRVSEVVSDWRLSDDGGGVGDWLTYRAVWVLTQLGGRGAIVLVLAVLVAHLCWTRRTLVPLVRVLVALALLTAVVYAFKWGTGRTAPAYPGSFFHRDGSSYPSGHVANATLMWGVARWQAVESGLPPRVQRLFWGLSVLAPVVAGLAMVSLDFHWVTDAVVGAAVGVLLLGVVHALDATVLSRWVHVRSGRLSSDQA